jgi:predicted small secreted protein
MLPLFVLSFAASVAGCGDTWRGAKQDTGENLQKSGQAIERAGESVKP